MSSSTRDDAAETPALAPAHVSALLTKHDNGRDPLIQLVSYFDTRSILQKQLTFAAVLALNCFYAGFLILCLATAAEHYCPSLRPYIALPSALTDLSGTWPWFAANGIAYVFMAPRLWAFLTGPCWLRARWGFSSAELIILTPTGPRRALIARLPLVQAMVVGIAALTELRRALIRAKHAPGLRGVTSDLWVADCRLTGAVRAHVARAPADAPLWGDKLWTRGDDGAREWSALALWPAEAHAREQFDNWSDSSRAAEIMRGGLRALGRGYLMKRLKNIARRQGGPLSYAQAEELFAHEGINYAVFMEGVYMQFEVERVQQWLEEEYRIG